MIFRFPGGTAVSASMLCFLIASVAAVSTPSLAQDSQGLMNIFGNMLGAAVGEAARAEWSKIGPTETTCLEAGLSRQGLSVERLIESGVQPDDPRISALRTTCSKFAGQLRRDVQCPIATPDGDFTSWCDEGFARPAENGTFAPVAVQDALQSAFSDDQITTRLFERADAQTRRLQMIAAGTKGGTVPAPNFDCAKAGTNSETAICRSYILSSLDGEYGELYQRTRSFDLKGLARTEALSLYHSALACEGSETCLKQNVTSGIDFMAGFLRQNGQTVVTSVERQTQAASQAALASAEARHLAAIDQLTALKAEAEKRTGPDTPDDLRSRLLLLAGHYQAVIAPPESPSPPRLIPPAAQALPAVACTDTVDHVGNIVCRDPGLQAVELDYDRSFYALRQIEPDQFQSLNTQAINFHRQLLVNCRVSDKGAPTAAQVRAAVACITAAYKRQKQVWIDRITQVGTPEALEEVARPILDQVGLQVRLQAGGYLPAQANIDGLYGTTTRQAIVAFETAAGLKPDGLMSDHVAKQLTLPPSASAAQPDSAPQEAIDALTVEYQKYLAVLDENDRTRTAQAAAAADRQSQKLAAEQLLAEPIPPDLRDFLANYIAAIQTGSDPAALEKLQQEFAARLPQIENMQRVVQGITAKNRFLLEGAAGDFVFLYNSSANAPSVLKNLQGTLVFNPDRTAVCILQESTTDRLILREVRETAGAQGAQLKLPLPRCNSAQLNTYDLAIVQRQTLWGLSSDEALPILSAVDGGDFSLVTVLPGAEIVNAGQRDQAKTAEIGGRIQSGSIDGFGVVVLDNQSARVCEIVHADVPAHAQVLSDNQERLADELGTSPIPVVQTADTAFVLAKKGQCGAVYAGAEDLKSLVDAFERDNVSYRILPIWVTQDDLTKAAAIAAAREKLVAERAADAARADADQKLIAAAKEGDRESVRQAQQAAMRKQYQSLATAFQNRLGDELKSFVSGESNTSFAILYPQLAKTYAAMINDKWEFMSVEGQISDYGTANFKERTLEAALVKSDIKMRNAGLGEYKDICFVTGYVNDAEFDMIRDPIGVECDGSDEGLRAYKLKERFNSRWFVN